MWFFCKYIMWQLILFKSNFGHLQKIDQQKKTYNFKTHFKCLMTFEYWSNCTITVSNNEWTFLNTRIRASTFSLSWPSMSLSCSTDNADKSMLGELNMGGAGGKKGMKAFGAPPVITTTTTKKKGNSNFKSDVPKKIFYSRLLKEIG